jgi:hypothetical protein
LLRLKHLRVTPGAYQPAGTPPTPYSTDPLPKEDSGAGRHVAAPGGSTRTVKAISCSTAAHETDGTTAASAFPGRLEDAAPLVT